ncbi:L-sorbose 1-dehydrogenase [Colletotrichum shisoi]|uniref:L-sorbose 1-dehydrogenase n=1 Tax=Colletotrichum shisoi TaxID=2078593 RepID=A0A5Q4BDT2_9PEZI|nr:L-sorbose 1-dehydrogenase [Colletotrichum shisoi]
MLPTDAWDYIVVGGGLAGSVVSSRLLALNNTAKILVIEAGRSAAGRSDILFVNSTSLVQGEFDWNYFSTPQAQLNNRVIQSAAGKGIGGGSLINTSKAPNNFVASFNVEDKDGLVDAIAKEEGKTPDTTHPLLKNERTLMEGFVLYVNTDPGLPPNSTYLTTANVGLHPTSRGSVKLGSCNPYTPPFTPLSQGIVEAGGTPAGLKLFTLESTDEEIEERIRASVTGTYHPMGTCAMGKVVDSDLRVKGVNTLRVVDAVGYEKIKMTNPHLDIPTQPFPETDRRLDYIKAVIVARTCNEWSPGKFDSKVEESFLEVKSHLVGTSLGLVSAYWLGWLVHFHVWDKAMKDVPFHDRKPFPWAKFVPSREPQNPDDESTEIITYRESPHPLEVNQPFPPAYNIPACPMTDLFTRNDETGLLSAGRRREVWRAVFPVDNCGARPFEIRVPNLYHPLEFSYDLDEANRLMGPTAKAEVLNREDPQGRRILVLAFGFTTGPHGPDTTVHLREIATAYKVNMGWAQNTALSGVYTPLYKSFRRFKATKARLETLLLDMWSEPSDDSDYT